MRLFARDEAQLGLLDGTLAADGAWRVRMSQRARRLAVRVLPGGLVEIVVPRGTRPRTIERFVTSHRRWIERTLEFYRPADPQPVAVVPQEIRFAATGVRYAVRFVEDDGPPRIRVANGTLELTGPGGRSALPRHALQRFAMREAHAALGPWLERLAGTSGLAYGRLQIRRQRTRWGSCSPSGTISLNACLLFQPPEVVNYLLVHELAHTRHMNHSRRFWRLVESLEPCWRELDAALTRGWRDVPAWAIG
jgi:predicted metal-dependent hydrolase